MGEALVPKVIPEFDEFFAKADVPKTEDLLYVLNNLREEEIPRLRQALEQEDPDWAGDCVGCLLSILETKLLLILKYGRVSRRFATKLTETMMLEKLHSSELSITEFIDYLNDSLNELRLLVRDEDDQFIVDILRISIWEIQDVVCQIRGMVENVMEDANT